MLVGGFRNLAGVLGNMVQQIDGCRVGGDLLVTSDAGSFSAHVLKLGFIEGSRQLEMMTDGS